MFWSTSKWGMWCLLSDYHFIIEVWKNYNPELIAEILLCLTFFSQKIDSNSEIFFFTKEKKNPCFSFTTHTEYFRHSWSPNVCVWGGGGAVSPHQAILQHQLDVLFNSILTGSGDSIRSRRLRAQTLRTTTSVSPQMPIASPDCYLTG